MKIITTTILGAALLFGASSASAYSVKSGDTLGEIASTHNVTLFDVMSANPQIGNPNVIFPNQDIQLPNEKSVEPKVESKVEAKPASTIENGMLARLVQAEANGESYAGKVAVAKVVLNRVASDQFPNDIRSVVYQPRQFSPVSNGMIHNQASDSSIRAANEALREGGNANGALYFFNPRYASGQSWFNTKQTAFTIGNHVFKY